jgi:hypothetical protein
MNCDGDGFSLSIALRDKTFLDIAHQIVEELSLGSLCTSQQFLGILYKKRGS